MRPVNRSAPAHSRGGCDGQGCLDSTTDKAPEPIAYKVRKPGRGNGWPVVAKLTYFIGDDEPILAVVWRNQKGTRTAISMPRKVLLDAKNRCARWFYLRDDNRMLMWRISINEFLSGRLHADGEHYVLLSQMQPVPWRDWAYAETEVYVDEQPAERQLVLALPGVTA